MDDFDKVNWKWLLGILGINLLHLLIHYIDRQKDIKVDKQACELQQLNDLIVKINHDKQLIAISFDKLHEQTLALIKYSPKPFKISNSEVRTFWKLASDYPKPHFDKHTTDKEMIRHRNQLFEYHQQVLTASQSILELRHQENFEQSKKINLNHKVIAYRLD